MAKTFTFNKKEQERKVRQIYINKVKRFARSKAGLKVVRQLAPEIARIIEEHPEYLDIPQNKNDPRLAGNYYICFFNQIFYTGESGNCVFRICEHIYNFCYSADAFGHQYDPTDKIPAKFEVFAWKVVHKEMRELIETKVIEVMQPILQYTDPNAPEYGRDKPIPEGDTRETMRSDICIFTNLKVDRFHKIQAEYNKNGEMK